MLEVLCRARRDVDGSAVVEQLTFNVTLSPSAEFVTSGVTSNEPLLGCL